MCASEESFIIVETISANSQQFMGPEANGFSDIISVNCSAKWCQLPNLVPDGLNLDMVYGDLLLKLRKFRTKQKLRSTRNTKHERIVHLPQ